MSVRTDILSFLRTPAAFSASLRDGDAELWRAGLTWTKAITEGSGAQLRAAQERAWEMFADRRTGLVLGPPGTGKSHLLSWFAVALAATHRAERLPCRVLVTAFTRNAAGNLLEAIAEKAARHLGLRPRVMYLGNPPAAGIPSGVEHFGRLNRKGDIPAVFEALAEDCVFAAASVWGLARILQSGDAPDGDGSTARLFDLVCIDEASQLVLAHGLLALAGLAEGGRIIVAGDDRQLPPVRVLQQTEIDGRQLGDSLYAFLKSVGAPEAVLEETFRLNAPLAEFPARRFYDGNYAPADWISGRRLALIDNWANGLEDWERIVLDPEFPIVVLLHEGPLATTSNQYEASLAVRLAKKIRERLPAADGKTFWRERLAIVSPHRAQNASIRSALAEEPEAMVDTVDRIQGKERDAVIFSYCVADPEFAIAEGEFIFSNERLNVAITRARSKLVMIVSRRLLDAIPLDQEVLDAAEIVREFIYSCRNVDLPPDFRLFGERVSLRLHGFEDDVILPAIEPPPPGPAEALPEMTPALEALLQAIRVVAAGSRYGNATISLVARRLARPNIVIGELRELLRLGHLTLDEREGQYGKFWTISPLDPQRPPFPVEPATVAKRIEEVVIAARRGRRAPLYRAVRNRFVWLEATGADVLMPILRDLAAEGALVLEADEKELRVDLPRGAMPSTPAEAPPPPAVSLVEDDFGVLNALEDLETRRINFGIVEAWTPITAIAAASSLPRSDVAASVTRLEQNGWLMIGAEQRVRSRMAELAREVRYVKQRFRKGDADQRPYLVRNLKVAALARARPAIDQPVRATLDGLRDALTLNPALQHAVDGAREMLSSLWGPQAKFAKFQARAIRQIMLAWAGEGTTSFVVSADTGSGKTEAAFLPLMIGAAADKAEGRRGTSSILIYPRVRLAANQAQRLANYLTAFASVPGQPLLTLGLQTGQVPEDFSKLDDEARELWISTDGALGFPFFACPACNAPLLLIAAGGAEGADRLRCRSCTWRYDGWIGSKCGLRASPPDFFLPTTESVHQWLHDPRNVALFGDLPHAAPPRAVLADEIHLYTHVHGAQVGYALRRVLARAEHNDPERRLPLAIGMSATLGDPGRSWTRLIGRDVVVELGPQADETGESQRGREYYYFIQPEVESRGRDIAGASTTIQSLMCLAHGMRRRTGNEGGYRSLVFLDSIDKIRRLHGAYQDAEEGKQLAAYRSRLYDDGSDGEPRAECCRDPVGCDCFREGECWYFAATDDRQWAVSGPARPGQPLAVAGVPIFSGTRGRAEDFIKVSDIVFATSSLEVGYDDPDITLVYQHYAPRNLASFVQRKGRGGRTIDDRSTTAVTLSPYSPRDSWFFRRPDLLLNPQGFDTPLNPDNLFVRRGQLAAALLDGFARWEARNQQQALRPDNTPRPEALADARALAELVFGSEPWRALGAASLEAFWRLALGALLTRLNPSAWLSAVRQAMSWVPNALFEIVNLPAVAVRVPEDNPISPTRREDITLALAAAAPGNMSRRYHRSAVYWIPPVEGRAPWLPAADYHATGYVDAGLEPIAALPIHARQALGPIHPELFRPSTISLSTVGKMYGAEWSSELRLRLGDGSPSFEPAPAGSDPKQRLHHQSQSSLRGTTIVTAEPARGHLLPHRHAAPWVRCFEHFQGDALARGGTGLHLSQVYWGADAEIRLNEAGADPLPITQFFVHPQNGTSLLHGYRVETEGVRFHLDSDILDAFVETEATQLGETTPDGRWHRSQMLHYLLERNARAIGVNAYEARRAADLLVSAAGDPDLRGRLRRLLRFWDESELARLFADTHHNCLAHHPLLSERRVERVAASLASNAFHDELSQALEALRDPVSFRKYLRSTVLHSLAVKLKQSFVLLGRGDEARVVSHVRLPLEYEEPDDIITIAELGQHGDGTTRSFVDHCDEALSHWRDGFLAECPSAQEDALLEALFAASENHERWRALDPRNEADLRGLAAELGDPEAKLPIASMVRLIFGREVVGDQFFQFFDIASAIRRVESALKERFQREPGVWELVSAVVRQAVDTVPPDPLAQLLAAYRQVEDASQEGSLGAEARLADQVFRLSARLCVDGCQACLHTGSDIMADSLAEATTSRRLLERYLAVG